MEKIVTSYKIKSTIKSTLDKHEQMLGAKISRVGVSDEFKQTISEITTKLRKF